MSTWTGRAWVFWVGVILAAQGVLILWLAEPARVPDRTRPQPAHVFVLAPNAVQGIQDFSEVTDPTLFALVNPRGFSRSAWLTVQPFEYEMTNSPGSPRWLSLSTDDLVDEFAEFVQTNVIPGDTTTESLPVILSRPVLPKPVVSEAAVLKVEGGLEGRAWTSREPLPTPSMPILTNSVVRVIVNPAGLALSAVLLASCGSAKADQEALDFAKGVRFEPVERASRSRHIEDDDGPVSGLLIFQWHRVRWNQPETATALR